MINHYIRSKNKVKKLLCKQYLPYFFRLIILIGSFFSFSPVFCQTTLFYTDFENTTSTFAANGWNIVNPGTNNWYVGTTVVYAGNKGAYISNNGGTNNDYTNSTWQNAHFYKDVVIPAVATGITLSFTYKGIGEADFDKLLVYTAPTSVTPATSYPAMWDDVLPGATLVFSQPVEELSWVTESVSLPNSLAGTTVRLIFTWQNDDNWGSNPAAAIDNISMAYALCEPPTITTQPPTTQTVCSGASVSMTAFASGTGLSYQWRKGSTNLTDGGNISGATSATLIINPVSATDAATNYNVVITDSCGTVTSNYSGLTITALPSATISYSGSPFCKSLNFAPVTRTGTTGGTYSSTPGLTINASNGTVTPASSTPGTYTVTYTMPAAGGCAAQTATASVTITALPSATISYSGSPFCKSLTADQPVTRTGTTGGTYSSDAGLTINATTGAITPNTSNAGTHQVTYTIAGSGGCSNYITSTNITITAPPVIWASNYGAECVGSTVTLSASYTSNVTYSWQGPDNFVSSVQNPDFIYTGTNAGTYTVTATTINGCVSAPASTTVTSIGGQPGLWTGNFSNDWGIAGNWCDGILPDATADVSIRSTAVRMPVITDSQFCRHITINSGATLVVTSTGVLNIAGHIYNNNNLDASVGTIVMAATVSQFISPNTFLNNVLNNLVISNTSASGVSLTGALDIYGSLTFTGTGKRFYTNDTLTLKSTATNTASVGEVTGNTITGKVTVERYISAHKAWRFLSVPTNTTQTVKETWQESGTSNTDNPVPGFGAQITGAGGTAAGFDLYTALPSMKTYDPLTNGWVGIANTNTLNIKSTEGYMAFIRGDRTSNAYNSPATETVLRTKGALYTGDMAPISVVPEKMASIGNPYASPIDFTKVTRTNGVDDKFYVWDPFISGYYNLGGYQTMSFINNWEPVPGGSPVYPAGVPCSTIQSGQAFFVHATTTGTFDPQNYKLYFEENDKVAGSALVSFAKPQGLSGTKPNRQFFRVSLYTGPSATDKIADGNAVAFDGNFSNEIDGNDALKIAASGENFDVKRSGKLLAIEARNVLTERDTIYYNMKLARKTYQLRFAPVNMASSGLEALLIDKFLNSTIPLSLIDSSFINIVITADAASASADRFKVVFRRMAVPPVTFTSIKATQKNADISVEWKVENESNMRQYEVETSSDGIHFAKAATVAPASAKDFDYNWLDESVSTGYHYYRIKSIDINGRVSFTQTVKVLVSKTASSITMSPNPISNGKINLHFTHQYEGIYNVRVTNAGGQVIISKAIAHKEGSSIETITVGNTLSRGIYQVEVTLPTGVVKIIKMIH